MNEKSPSPEEPNLPRMHFHLALALLFIPFAGWALAIIDVWRGYANRAQLVWTRLLVALVAVDALALASLVWIGAHQEEFQPRAPLDAHRSMIGVGFESADALKVREAPEGLPGARAGLRAGDVIEKIDGKAVATVQDLSAEIQAKDAGIPRTLGVRRESATFEAPVTPERIPKVAEHGLFEIEPVADFRLFDEAILAQLPALVLVGLLAGWARRSPSGAVPVWSGFLLSLLGSLGASMGFLALVKRRNGGLSLGHFLISLLVQTVMMVILTAVARTWMTRGLPPAARAMSWLRAALQGLFYLIAGALRLGFILIVAVHLLSPEGSLGDPMVSELSQARFGPAGAVLLLLGVAVIGPFAEEFLFRGYLLPRLAAQWGEVPALASSSLLFALLHLRDGPFLPLIFFYGWVFGWARLRSGGILAPTLLHMAVNSVAALAILMQGFAAGPASG